MSFFGFASMQQLGVLNFFSHRADENGNDGATVEAGKIIHYIP